MKGVIVTILLAGMFLSQSMLAEITPESLAKVARSAKKMFSVAVFDVPYFIAVERQVVGGAICFDPDARNSPTSSWPASRTS